MNHTPSYNQSGHFASVLPREKADLTIRESLRLLRNSNIDFDTFVFCGLSGALLAPILAYEMSKHLLMVRKCGGNDGSHSSAWVEGNISAQRIIVVDDIICSGATMANMMHALRHKVKPTPTIVGLLLHCNSTDIDMNTVPCLYRADHRYFRLMIESEEKHLSPRTGLSADRGRAPMYEGALETF